LCATSATTLAVFEADVQESEAELHEHVLVNIEVFKHQSEAAPVFYVTEKVGNMDDRAEWIRFELDQHEFVLADLPDVARIFLRFMGHYVHNNQQKTVL